jgi:hypothetical protein
VEYGSLLGRLNNESLWAQGFADDIAIDINGKFLSTVCELRQKALFIVQTWCREVGLSVNADKTSIHQQQEVSGLQEVYTIWNGIAVEKSS